MEIAEVLEQHLQEFELPEAEQLQEVDAGAEEELFRRMGQQVVCQKLGQRWQAADQTKEAHCSQCKQKMKALGRRAKRIHSLCGPIALQRQVFYCPRCRQTEAPLDRRLGVGIGEVTAGLRRLICRTSLELAYQSSQQLLTDSLGFEPCSTREVERICRWHGADLEKQQKERGWAASSAIRKPLPTKSHYCIAIDGVMIPGLADVVEHRLQWHEVKVAVIFDPRRILPESGREK